VYYFDYYKGEQEQEKKNQDSILIPISKGAVTRVELKNTSGEMELIKNDDSWGLKRPLVDLAAADEADGWVQSLTTEKTLEKIGEGEVFEWSTYGLDKPRAILDVYGKTGEKIHLEISGKKSFEGNPFIKKNDEKAVYVGTSTWSSLADKSTKDVRDKRVLRNALAELENVSVQQRKFVLQLKMLEGKWVAPVKPGWRLDQNKVREVVNAVQDMRATEFTLETDPDKDQMSTYGFGPKGLSVIYQLKGEKTYVFQFGQDRGKSWYAWPKDLKRVVKVDSAQVEKITKANLNELRDREEPFVFNKEDVKKLNIKAERNLELSKEGENWKSSVPGNVEGTEVTQLLEQIRQLRVAEFLDGKPTAPGLEGSKKLFMLADVQGKNLLELKIGDSFKKKEDKIEKTYFYAKSSSYPDVILLKEEDVKALATEKLLKLETKPEAIKPENTSGEAGALKQENKNQ
jgi:hypothetical protein